MPSKRVYVDHLRAIDLFAGFSRKELEVVASAGQHLSVPAGTTLITQNDAGYDAYILLAGEVQVKRNGRTVHTEQPGAIIGELALLDHAPRSATAICATDCDILVLSRGAFRGTLDRSPALTRKLMASMAARVRELDNRAYG